MVALYRCGRQADALEAYSAARRVLLDELGVEPGPALRRAAGGDPAPGPGARACAWCVAAAGATSPRRIALLAAGGAVLLAAAAAAAVLLASSDRETHRAPIGANVVAAIDLADGAVSDAVDVGPSPSHLALDGRTLWVTNADGRSVSRVDLDDRSGAPDRHRSAAARPASPSPPARRGWPTAATAPCRGSTGTRTPSCRPSPSGTNPTGVTAGAGAIWVANSGDQTISRIDPRSGGATTIDVHAEPDRDRRRRRRGLDHQLEQPHRLPARPPIGTRELRAGSPWAAGRARSRSAMARCGWPTASTARSRESRPRPASGL